MKKLWSVSRWFVPLVHLEVDREKMALIENPNSSIKGEVIVKTHEHPLRMKNQVRRSGTN